MDKSVLSVLDVKPALPGKSVNVDRIYRIDFCLLLLLTVS